MIICFLTEKRKRRRYIVEELEYDKNTARNLQQYLTPPEPPALQTCNYRFKDLYALSNFKKDINPISAIYESLQRALSKNHKNKFDHWIISFAKNNKETIIDALDTDIKNLQPYIQKVGSHGDPQHYRLLKNFIDYNYFFKNDFKD